MHITRHGIWNTSNSRSLRCREVSWRSGIGPEKRSRRGRERRLVLRRPLINNPPTSEPHDPSKRHVWRGGQTRVGSGASRLLLRSRCSIVLHSMRRFVPTLSALILLLAASSADAARSSHRAPSTCRLPAHARMLVADPQAQVYEKLETETQEKGIYGCVYGSRRTFFLGEPAPSVGTPSGIEGITLETLAGSVVAYEYASAGPGRGGLGSGTGYAEWFIVVRDLRNGRVLHKIPTGNSASSTHVGSGPAMAIVAKSDGAVAWIAENDSLSTREAKDYEVHALDRSGSRVLASGSGIEPLSLGVVGSTLYWMQSGKPASATLN